jgi:hypothetical protein
MARSKGKTKRSGLSLLPRSKFARALAWRRFQQKKVPSGKAYKRVSKTEVTKEEE